jgi:hypothetical protein
MQILGPAAVIGGVAMKWFGAQLLMRVTIGLCRDGYVNARFDWPRWLPVMPSVMATATFYSLTDDKQPVVGPFKVHFADNPTPQGDARFVKSVWKADGTRGSDVLIAVGPPRSEPCVFENYPEPHSMPPGTYAVRLAFNTGLGTVERRFVLSLHKGEHPSLGSADGVDFHSMHRLPK